MASLPKRLTAFLLLTQSPVIRAFFVKAMLNHNDAILIRSETKEEALQQLLNTQISYILIDDKTPSLELSLFCEKIRSLPEYHYIPILIISSQLKKGFMRQALRAGATDFLRHPLDEEEFFHRLEMAEKVMQTEHKVAELTAQFHAISPTPSPLTMRTILDDRAVRLIGTAIQQKKGLALLILEIDQLPKLSSASKKNIKKLLVDYTEKHVKALLRKQDLLFHPKSGQFVLLLPNTSKRAAEFIAENIQSFFKDHPISMEEIFLPITVSIGLTLLSEKEKRKRNPAFYLDHLLREAQTCLNEAKQTGNTIISY